MAITVVFKLDTPIALVHVRSEQPWAHRPTTGDRYGGGNEMAITVVFKFCGFGGYNKVYETDQWAFPSRWGRNCSLPLRTSTRPDIECVHNVIMIMH